MYGEASSSTGIAPAVQHVATTTHRSPLHNMVDSIPTLTEKSNYHDWSYFFETYFEALADGTYELVFVSKLPDDAEVKGDAWKKDKTAKAILLSKINATFIPQVRDCKSSYDLWARIRKMCNPISAGVSARKRSALWSVRFDKDATITQHTSKIIAAATELRSCGETVTTREIGQAILESLPPRFATFVNVYYHMNPIIDHEEVINQLTIEAERQQQALAGNDSQIPVVLPISREERRGTNNAGAQQPREGNKANKQRGKANNVNKSDHGDVNAGTCIWCADIDEYSGGHTFDNCRKRRAFEKAMAKANLAPPPANILALILSAALLVTPKSNIIKLDTCAEVHACNDSSMLSDFVASPLIVKGVGSRASSGYGRMTVTASTGITFSINKVYYLPDLPYNILSSARVHERGFDIEVLRAPHPGCVIKHAGEPIVNSIPNEGFALDLKIHHVSDHSVNAAIGNAAAPTSTICHPDGHASNDTNRNAVKHSRVVDGNSKPCEPYVTGEHAAGPLVNEVPHSTNELRDMGAPRTAIFGFFNSDSIDQVAPTSHVHDNKHDGTNIVSVAPVVATTDGTAAQDASSSMDAPLYEWQDDTSFRDASTLKHDLLDIVDVREGIGTVSVHSVAHHHANDTASVCNSETPLGAKHHAIRSCATAKASLEHSIGLERNIRAKGGGTNQSDHIKDLLNILNTGEIRRTAAPNIDRSTHNVYVGRISNNARQRVARKRARKRTRVNSFNIANQAANPLN